MSVLDKIKSGELVVVKHIETTYIEEGSFKEGKILVYKDMPDEQKELLGLAEVGDRMRWTSILNPPTKEGLYFVAIKGTPIVLIKPFTGRFEEGFTHWMPIMPLSVDEN